MIFEKKKNGTAEQKSGVSKSAGKNMKIERMGVPEQNGDAQKSRKATILVTNQISENFGGAEAVRIFENTILSGENKTLEKIGGTRKSQKIMLSGQNGPFETFGAHIRRHICGIRRLINFDIRSIILATFVSL